MTKKVDLKKEKLYVYSLVPQKIDRVGVGLHYTSYSATTNFSSSLKWDQYPDGSSYEIESCAANPFKTSELNSTQISVLWELRIKDQMRQVLRNNEIANNFPVNYCTGNGSTGSITKMEITRFMSYRYSSSSLFYRHQPLLLLGKIYHFMVLLSLFFHFIY